MMPIDRLGESPVKDAFILAERCVCMPITFDEIRGPLVPVRLAYPRHAIMWWLRATVEWSYPKIGRSLGGRDHCTVFRAIRAIDAELADGARGARSQILLSMIGLALQLGIDPEVRATLGARQRAQLGLGVPSIVYF